MSEQNIKNKIENIDIEAKYQSMSELEHILSKPGMYIGSIYFESVKYLLYKPSENKIVQIDNVGYNAGLIKLFDEVFQNSIDELKRKSALYKITEINVEVYKSGKVIIQDNGGIPVILHKGTNMMLPKMIFGHLRTSSNYTEERDGSGTNGIGAKIANIFSTKFHLTTSDGNKKYDICWKNNMKDVEFENTTKSNKGEHFSRFEYDIELSRFDNISQLDMSTVRIMQKRCIDGAASNPGLKITFKTDLHESLNSDWLFKSFEEFVNLHLNDTEQQQLNVFKFPNGDSVCLYPNNGINYSFVNGGVCNDVNGTHFKQVKKQINDYILKVLKDKDITLITETDINNKISYFINFSMSNPDYSSQTKEKLTSKLNSHQLHLTKDFLQTLDDSEILKQIVDYYNVKYLAEAKKQLRSLNKTLKNTKSKKLTKCGSKNTNLNKLFLFEGTSASNGFQKNRDAMFEASYELRGKVRNSFSLNREEIIQNLEWREILAACGLQFLSPSENLKNLAYNQIIIGSDADVDGYHINGLILAFFCKHFPELIKAGKIYRLEAPIIIVTNKSTKEEYWFYSNNEWDKTKDKFTIKVQNKLTNKLESKFDNKNFSIEYYKGLGSLEDHHYERLIRKPRLIKFEFQDIKKYLETVEVWFGKSAELRKQELLGDNEEIQFDTDFE